MEFPTFRPHTYDGFLSMPLGGSVGNSISSAHIYLSVYSCSTPLSLAMLETQRISPRLITFGSDTTSVCVSGGSCFRAVVGRKSNAKR